jgi:hypothetical protein
MLENLQKPRTLKDIDLEIKEMREAGLYKKEDLKIIKALELDIRKGIIEANKIVKNDIKNMNEYLSKPYDFSGNLHEEIMKEWLKN